MHTADPLTGGRWGRRVGAGEIPTVRRDGPGAMKPSASLEVRCSSERGNHVAGKRSRSPLNAHDDSRAASPILPHRGESATRIYRLSIAFLQAFYSVSIDLLSVFYWVSIVFLLIFYWISTAFLSTFYRFSTGFLPYMIISLIIK